MTTRYDDYTVFYFTPNTRAAALANKSEQVIEDGFSRGGRMLVTATKLGVVSALLAAQTAQATITISPTVINTLHASWTAYTPPAGYTVPGFNLYMKPTYSNDAKTLLTTINNGSATSLDTSNNFLLNERMTFTLTARLSGGAESESPDSDPLDAIIFAGGKGIAHEKPEGQTVVNYSSTVAKVFSALGKPIVVSKEAPPIVNGVTYYYLDTGLNAPYLDTNEYPQFEMYYVSSGGNALVVKRTQDFDLGYTLDAPIVFPAGEKVLTASRRTSDTSLSVGGKTVDGFIATHVAAAGKLNVYCTHRGVPINGSPDISVSHGSTYTYNPRAYINADGSAELLLMNSASTEVFSMKLSTGAPTAVTSSAKIKLASAVGASGKSYAIPGVLAAVTRHGEGADAAYRLGVRGTDNAFNFYQVTSAFQPIENAAKTALVSQKFGPYPNVKFETMYNHYSNPNAVQVLHVYRYDTQTSAGLIPASTRTYWDQMDINSPYTVTGSILYNPNSTDTVLLSKNDKQDAQPVVTDIVPSSLKQQFLSQVMNAGSFVAKATGGAPDGYVPLSASREDALPVAQRRMPERIVVAARDLPRTQFRPLEGLKVA